MITRTATAQALDGVGRVPVSMAACPKNSARPRMTAIIITIVMARSINAAETREPSPAMVYDSTTNSGVSISTVCVSRSGMRQDARSGSGWQAAGLHRVITLKSGGTMTTHTTETGTLGGGCLWCI